MSEFKTKLEQTRKKLLDLTKRNKLINYKKPAKSRHLKIIDESAEFIYQHLVFDEKIFKFKFIPEPEIPQLEHKKLENKKAKIANLQQKTLFEGEKQVAEHQIQKIFEELQSVEADALLTAEEQAKKLGFDISNELPEIDLTKTSIDNKYIDNYLQTLHYPADLEKILKKIELNSRSIIQETGTNMLYMILGVLEWTESDSSEIKLKSPLINIPVTLKRGSLNKKTNTYEYVLEYNGESIDTNKSLAEKLKNDFNILLPELTEEISFTEYMLEVKKILKNKKNWNIRQEVSLDFLQFSKILMYKDLDTEIWDGLLDDNEVLNDLFLGKEISGISYSPEEYDIDSHKTAVKIPLVLDADSSQHSAIVDVLDGKNVVIEGPPGTGKSQTISNIIATLMAEGKSVLFVSEKLAALEVVHKRLSSIGLGDFCLELHSHKTQKLKVLDSLKKRIEGKYKDPNDIEIIKSELNNKKDILQKYISTLHTKFGNTEKKIFEIFWLVEKYNKVSEYLKFDIINPESYSIIDINNRAEELKKYQSYVINYDFKSFYWNGFNLDSLEFIDIDIFVDKLNILNSTYKKITTFYTNIKSELESNSIIYDIENEIEESKNIDLFLTQNKKYINDSINQSLLNQLYNNKNVFENYIELTKEYKKVKQFYNANIKGLDKISFSEMTFLTKLDNNLLKEIDTKYLKPKKECEVLHAELYSNIDINKSTLEDENENLLVEKLLSIKNFLYEDIDIETIKYIYDLNENFTVLLSKFEKVIKELSRFIGLSNIYDVYTIRAIIKGLKLISTINIKLYINCTDEIGTSQYISLINKAKSQENEIFDLIQENEKYFDIDEINLKSIEELNRIKEIILDKKDSFFKIFSGAFKQAKNSYSNLLKGKIPDDSNEWILQLDKAIKYLTLKEIYEENNDFIITFRNLFKGLDTNWDEIDKLNTWALTIRQEIKINDFMKSILSGDEQIYISLTSYHLNFIEYIQSFDVHIEKIEKVYSKYFIKKLYQYIDDIDIVELNHKLEEINENIEPLAN